MLVNPVNAANTETALREVEAAAHAMGLQIQVLNASTTREIAAKGATTTIPIVFVSGSDPVQFGLDASFNRPGGNATGVSIFTAELGPKRLGLLRELLPKPGTIAFVVSANSALTPYQIQEIQVAAQ